MPELINVLLVDDNSKYLKDALPFYGYEVTTAFDGIQALKELANKSKNFDIVLLDVMMPNMNGLNATRAIRELNRIDSNLPIIALSANAYAEDIKKTKDAGMDDYVSKPFKIENLVEMIDKYC